MDMDEFRMILSNTNMDVWTLIDTAITVASLDYGDELKDRRDGIVERLYSSSGQLCRNCSVVDDGGRLNSVEITKIEISPTSHEAKARGSPLTPESNHRSDDENEDLDPYAGLFDDEQTKILGIKERLEHLGQSEEYVVELLQNLTDMDITFKALKETDIGRNVNRLRKHPSNEVRRLVKQLVRKWKYIVDEWVRLNQPEHASSNLIADGDSPLQNIPKNTQNGHPQLPDFAYSPNPHTGSSGSDKNNSEPEQKPKSVPRRETPSKPAQPSRVSASAPPPPNRHESRIDLEKLNSSRRRLQENYQDAQNAKKQRTIQVMDIHEIPKPKNTFFAKNKGGFQGRQHR